jgi:glutathione reductase (NADPH)
MDFDLFTIGAGSGGVRASRMAANAGARVAIAEDAQFGGTCVNLGCVPKKLMVHASELRHELTEGAGFGWTASGTFDWPTFRANKDKAITRLSGLYEKLLHGSGCEIVRGRASIVDAHTVEVAGKRYTAENILVATGARAVRPSEPGTEDAWVSDDVFHMDALPERILVVGAGYIALEMACIFHGLGSKVSVVYRGAHPLRGFDDDTRSFLLDELRKKGLELHMNTTVLCLEKKDGATFAMLSHDEELEVDAVLYAIGRKPNSEGIGLEEVGVERNERGAILVDDRFRTSVPSIYAIGDVTDRMNLTPVAIAEAMSLVDHLYGAGGHPIDYELVPTAVFTQPPLAAVGLTEAQARDRFETVDVYTSEFRPLKHSMSGSTERAFMKIVVEPESDRVVGIHLVSPSAPEIIQGFAAAMVCGATKGQLDATIALHPTAAEELVTMRERRADKKPASVP